MKNDPVGAYPVFIEAADRAGNISRETASILILAPGVTPTPLPTRTPGASPMALETLQVPLRQA